jgi:Ca-activated chloride channel family protein
MIINMIEITWGALQRIVWLPVFVGMIMLLLYRYDKQSKGYELLAGSQFALLRNVSPKKRMIKCFCMIVGLLFLFLAMLRPQWNKSEETVMQEGRDLYIALDISRSMLAADCTPNRLVWAKEKIKRLVKKLSCERVGLILFSGSAFVQCPLTTDYAAFFSYLDSVDAELISSGTTALDQAIGQAITSFSAVPERKSKLLVVVTDGEDFSHDLTGIKQQATDCGLSIFSIGVGSAEGAPVPLVDAYGVVIGHQKDARGAIVISRLNEGILDALSRDVGGCYVRTTENDDDINTVVRSIQRREKEQIGEQKYSRYEDQYPYFLLVSFVCFLIEWLL